MTRAGEIVHVGSLEQAEQLPGARREVDLGGGCLMPGFIDPHIHPSMAGQWYEVFKSLPNAVSRSDSVHGLDHAIRLGSA